MVKHDLLIQLCCVKVRELFEKLKMQNDKVDYTSEATNNCSGFNSSDLWKLNDERELGEKS
jgi:hypothetical protein